LPTILVLISLTGLLLSAPAWAGTPVPVAKLPAPVTAAVQTAHAGANLVEAEQEGDNFHVDIKLTDGARHTLQISSAGKLLSDVVDQGDPGGGAGEGADDTVDPDEPPDFGC